MATVKIPGLIGLNSTLLAMRNNTGTARIDEFYFQTVEVTTEEILDNAYKKDVLINVETVYNNIIKITFNLRIG
jgi:hypothetical protein